MKIRHIHIHNHRSIRDLELDIQDWMVFLGPNNHGKSNPLNVLILCKKGCKIGLWKNKHVTDQEGFLKK